jgi:hypothetical protein
VARPDGRNEGRIPDYTGSEGVGTNTQSKTSSCKHTRRRSGSMGVETYLELFGVKVSKDYDDCGMRVST